jgi:hypothetical protein
MYAEGGEFDSFFSESFSFDDTPFMRAVANSAPVRYTIHIRVKRSRRVKAWPRQRNVRRTPDRRIYAPIALTREK